ncbi:MAG TPA: phosphatidylserine/phosphatidylglycerophosphate/cardiolipin synthase family protein [Burkholderiales bacterium]|nr:phosphatidylserine/phosphatidylglycerophosphate/cardiolipin synthase family protein [Burkholderiales bacterium]
MTAVALAIGAALLAAVAILGLAIWSIKAHREPRLTLRPEAPLQAMLPSLAGLALGAPTAGNAVELLEDAAFFDALLADIGAARRTVHFETFLWKEGVLGQRVADALSAAARAGRTVRVVLDANGCKRMGRRVREQLRAAGCGLAFYHPRTLANIGVVLERDHRKIAVLDGRIAYVGGHCITDEWIGEGGKPPVRDVSVRLRGPVVHAIQSAFCENWVEVTGHLFAGDDSFPPLEEAGETVAHVASLKPEGSPPAVKLLHYGAICLARKRLWIQNPYFLPEPEARQAFAEAVRRGVDVRVMMPAAEVSDMPLVQHAAHRNFQRLLEDGVRLFEYRRVLLHQKVMTADGTWCAVGTTNFDVRSLETDDQITVGFQDAALAARLERMFEHDLQHCVELDAASWRRRPALHRLKDNTLHLLKEVL